MVQSVKLRGLQFQAVTGVVFIFVLYPSLINFEDLKQRRKRYGTFTYPQGLQPVYVHVFCKGFLCVSCNLEIKMTIKIYYTRLPWKAGSSRNHMIHNCPTTSQETFNDGYNQG